MQIEIYNSSVVGDFFMNIMRNICFFILAALCLNSLNTLASEYRPRHSVPRYNNKAHGKSFFLFSPFIVFGKFADGLSDIHMTNVGKLFENIDFSSGSHIVQEYKVMLSVAGAVIALSLLIKQLQSSETCGKWLSEKYTQVSISVDNCTSNYIKECPLSVQLAITPIKIVIQFLCAAIKKCIAMNSKTIVFSVVAPVAGKVLDGVCVCPIPLLNFTSIGGMVSGCIITKGYFDSSFEKVNEKLDGVEKKMDENQLKVIGEINEVKEEVGRLSEWFQSLNQKSDTIVGYVQDCGTRLKSIGSRVINLEIIAKKNSQQLGSIESQLFQLRQEL